RFRMGEEVAQEGDRGLPVVGLLELGESVPEHSGGDLLPGSRAGGPAAVAALHGRGEQAFLAPEVLHDESGVDAGPPGDGADGGPLVALLGEEPAGLLEDARLRAAAAFLP